MHIFCKECNKYHTLKDFDNVLEFARTIIWGIFSIVVIVQLQEEENGMTYDQRVICHITQITKVTFVTFLVEIDDFDNCKDWFSNETYDQARHDPIWIAINLNKNEDRNKARQDENELLNFEELDRVLFKIIIDHSSYVVKVLNVFTKLFDDVWQNQSLFKIIEW